MNDCKFRCINMKNGDCKQSGEECIYEDCIDWMDCASCRECDKCDQ